MLKSIYKKLTLEELEAILNITFDDMDELNYIISARKQKQPVAPNKKI